MAIKSERYYYFVLSNGTPYRIKVTLTQINTDIMKMYQAMTEEQKEFYLANPDATVMEVWNCQLTPPYEPPTPDVQEYAAQKVKELKDACYASVSVTTLEYAVAEDKVNNITADSYYSLASAREVLSNFRAQSKKALTVYNTYKTRIEAAVSSESVDIIYNEAINQLNS